MRRRRRTPLPLRQLTRAHVAGFLVGGASLKPEFVTIINAVAQSAKL